MKTKFNIKTFQGGYDKNFSYLIWCNKTLHASIIDPAVEIELIIKTIKKNNLLLKKILVTHTHADHIYYLNDFYVHFSFKLLVSNIILDIISYPNILLPILKIKSIYKIINYLKDRIVQKFKSLYSR